MEACLRIYAMMCSYLSLSANRDTHTRLYTPIHPQVSDSATPWTVACQAPLTMGFSRQEY